LSKKIFSLIHGENIHVTPQVKKIQAEDLSLLLSAEELLKKTKEDAERYVKEVTEEAEKIKEKAQAEGFEEGFRKWVEKIQELEKEIQNVHEEVTRVVVPVALQAAKKIVGREMELNKETVVDIVASNLKAVSQHKKIKIFVSREDLLTLEKNKQRLKEVFDVLESLSIVPRDDIKSGGCVIETEGGIINAQLDNKWEILERAFSSFMKT